MAAPVLQLPEDAPRLFHHRLRQARKLGHLDAVAPVCAAGDDLAQEDELLPPAPDGDAVVFHPGDGLLQGGQLVVVGGKEGLGPQLLPVRAVLQHRPGNAHAVKGAGAPADLVQNQKAPAGGVLKDIRHLGHLHHKGGLPGPQVVACPDAGKDAVHHADAGRPRRDKGPHLGHEGDEGHLAHISGFPRHVGAGDDGHTVLPLPHIGVVGHEEGPGEHPLHHRMASVVDLDDAPLVHLRAAVVVFHRRRGQGAQRVQLRHGGGGALDALHPGGDLGA